MYGDVHVSVVDGRPSQQNQNGRGVQFKIGISDAVSDVPILITGAMKIAKIKELLGETPLTDACMDSLEWGAQMIYCIPVVASIAGNITVVEPKAEGAGTIELLGTPNNAYEILVQIIEGGASNEGTFIYSIDGGNSYTNESTIPITGTVDIPHTGLTLKFEDGAGAFDADDTFEFMTTAPTMNNAMVLEAIYKIVNYNIAFEFVHIVGATSKALWTTLGVVAEDFLATYKKPCFFVCEARGKSTDEDTYEYVEAMLNERKNVTSAYVQVVLSHSRYIRMDGREQIINNAGIVTGMYCNARESQSIGEVKSFAVPNSKMLGLIPTGIEECTEELDEARYLTFRQYAGRDEYFVTSARMFAADSSYYPYAEDVRVSNRLVKAVREKLLEELQVEIDPADQEVELARIAAEANIPLEAALADGIISSGEVTIDSDNIDLSTKEEIEVFVTYVQMGHIRAMQVAFLVENPNTTELVE